MSKTPSLKYLLIAISCFLFTHQILADDVGISKVRLIQKSDTSYVLEADMPQNLLNSIKKPVFPNRFSIGKIDYENLSGWITLKINVSTSGKPLQPEEEILLPWDRNGVDFTAQWLDGTSYKGLFNKTLTGISIPLSEVMFTKKTTGEVLKEGFLTGLMHLRFQLIHVLFIFIVVWAQTTAKAFRWVSWFSLGQCIALVLSEIRFPAFDLVLSDWLIVILIFSLSYAIAYKKQFKFLAPALIICGVFHGLSYYQFLDTKALETAQKIQSLLSFNLAIDLGHFTLTAIFLILVPKLKKFTVSKKAGPLAAGILSVFLILSVYFENIQKGNTEILNFESDNQTVTQKSIPSSGSNNPVIRTSGQMTTPVMIYLSIEPYEIRQEILIKLEYFDEKTHAALKSNVIPIEVQEEVKSLFSDVVVQSTLLRVNNNSLESAISSSNFIRLSRGGVTLREKPREENIKEAIIGLTTIYDVEGFPDSLSLHWDFFPENINEIEISVVDPHGNLTALLNETNPVISWESRLKGYQPTSVEPVSYIGNALPVLSILIWISVIILLITYRSRKTNLKRIIILILVISFLIYPFIRIQVPFIKSWKPTPERAETILSNLISNVYRAFDRRNEEAVYDRLALSVSGDQLTQIFLENRKAMVLENKGGARAKVDEIELLQVEDIKRSENGIMAKVDWTVRGSVSHFGHTHYRKNQYQALVSFKNIDELWKITSIETIEEKRIF